MKFYLENKDDFHKFFTHQSLKILKPFNLN